MKMPFGKHKGTPIEEIPNDYLRWLDSIELADWCFKWDLAKKDEVRIAVTEEVARRRALEESQPKCDHHREVAAENKLNQSHHHQDLLGRHLHRRHNRP